MKSLLRAIPPVHELKKHEQFQKLQRKYLIEEERLTALLRDALSDARHHLLSGKWQGEQPGTEAFISKLFARLENRLNNKFSYRLKRVINATGTVLHTNLGRAVLSDEAVRHVMNIASNYSNLEYDLESGKRGSRHSHIEEWIKEMTGAEAAMVVNNNAAAVYFILKALAKGKEVIVSRGQLVEIGGSFRVSSIMEESGAILREVGTTNKTHLSDYENSINENTSMIMKVHTSNFKIIGFTKNVESEKLIELSRKHDHIIYYEDLGSGVLYDLPIGEEPLVQEVIKKGADLVSFSGDKLLGGPQAGIIAGKKYLIDRLKKHQLARVLRVDKMTLAALEATLAEYVSEKRAAGTIPVLKDLLVSEQELNKKAQLLANMINDEVPSISAIIEKDESTIGGGSLPEETMPTYTVVLDHFSMSAESLHKSLRTQSPSVVARIRKDKLIFDVRTIREKELAEIKDALKRIFT